MARLGATITSTPSTSGRCLAQPCCGDLRDRLAGLPSIHGASPPLRQRVGSRVAASLCVGSRGSDGNERRPSHLAAAVANAASVVLERQDPIQQDVVPSLGLTQQQISTADAQKAIERLRVATLELRRNMGDDRWTGFTVSLMTSVCPAARAAGLPGWVERCMGTHHDLPRSRRALCVVTRRSDIGCVQDEDKQLLRNGHVLHEQERAAQRAARVARKAGLGAQDTPLPPSLSLPVGEVSEETVAGSRAGSTRNRTASRRKRLAGWGKPAVRHQAPTASTSSLQSDSSGDGMKMFLRVRPWPR